MPFSAYLNGIYPDRGAFNGHKVRDNSMDFSWGDAASYRSPAFLNLGSRRTRMLKLEQIVRNAVLTGLEPGQAARVVSAEPSGPDAVAVVYKTNDGRAGERVGVGANGW